MPDVSNVARVGFRTFIGSHHEVGVQQGRAGRQQIRESLEKIPNYEFVKLMKPRLLPTRARGLLRILSGVLGGRPSLCLC